MFLDPLKKLFQSKEPEPVVDKTAPVAIEHRAGDHLPDTRPGAGKLKPEQFAKVRAAVLGVCRKHGKVGPDDVPIGAAIDFYVVEEPNGNERYQYVEVGSPAGLNEDWLRELMAHLKRCTHWGVAVGVGEGRFFIFPDKLIVCGDTFAGVDSIGGVIERARRDLDLERLISTCRDDAGLEQLAKLPGIDQVRMRLNLVEATDAGLGRVAGLRGLVGLILGSKISDAGLAALAPLGKLEELIFEGSPITDAGLTHLAPLGSLTELSLSDTRIGAAGLAHLIGLSSLQTLMLNNTAVDDAALAHLAGLTGLKKLALSGTTVSDAGLLHLLPLAGTLEELWLGATSVTDQGLKHLRVLEKLRSLDLSHTRTTDAGLKLIYELPVLERIELIDTFVTDQGVAELRGTLVTLVSVEAHRTPSEKYRQAAVALERRGAVVRLDHAADGSPKSTTSVHLERFWRGGDDLSRLQELNPVRWVSIERAALSDAAFQHLQGLPALEGLSIATTPIGPRGLAHLHGLAKLNRVFLEQLPVDGSMIAALAALPELTWIGLKGSTLDDAALAELAKLTKLVRLDLARTGLNAAAIAALQQALPGCDLEGV